MTGASKSHGKLKARYARVFEGADQCFWEWNLKTSELRFSNCVEAMLGYAPGEMPGHEDGDILIPPEKWAAYTHPDDLAKAWESIERHLQGLTPTHEVELRCKTKSGEWKWFLVKGRIAERDKDGNPLIMSGIYADITIRKQAEEALCLSEERFRIALANSQTTVFEQDLELCYTYNHRPYFEYSPEQALGKRDRDLLEPACAAELEAFKRSVINTETPLRREFSLTTPDGRNQHFDLYAEPRRNETGKVAGIICTAVDITARVNTEERTRRLASLYRTLSETSEAILKFTTPAELFSHVCRIVVEYSGMVHAWVGIPNSAGRFISAGRYGKFADPTDPSRLADPFSQFTVLATPERPKGRVPSSVAFRKNRAVVVNDILGDERLAPWHEYARNNRVNSMAVFPIVKIGHPYGVLSVYNDEAGFFDDEIVALLKSLAGNLGFALDRLEHQTLLVESEQRFRTLFENAGDGIFIGDKAGQLIDANANGSQMLGYSREEIRKLSVRDILAEHERSLIPDNWEGWDVGSNAVSAWTFLRKDGSTFEGDVNSQVLPDGRFMGILRDVTERNRHTAFLEEKEALLRSFIENTPAAVAMFDRHMRYLAVSRRFIENFHLDGYELIGRSHYEVFPDIPERWQQFHWRALAGETIRMEEDRFDRENGSTEWQRWEIQPWHSGSEIGGIVLFVESITERKQAEERVHKLSAQFQLALYAAHLGSWNYDLTTQTAFYDARHREIFQMKGNAQPYGEILKRMHPDDLPDILTRMDAALNPADPKPYKAEYRIILPDGSVRWIQAHGTALFEGEEQARHAVSLIGTVNDVTEQHQIEEEKARLSTQRQLALDAAHLGWWCYDPVTRISTYDERYKKIFGFDKDDDVTFEKVQRRFHPNDFPALLNQIAAAQDPANPQPYHYEFRIILPGGSIRWIQGRGMTLFEGNGEKQHVVMMAGTVEDITEKKETTERLRESEEKFRTLVEGASDAYFVHDADGRIIEVNRIACESLGYDREQLLQMNVSDVDPDFDLRYARSIWGPPAPESILTISSHHRRKDGVIFPVEIKVSSLTLQGQQLFVALVRDMTEHEQAKEALKLAAAVYKDSSEAMIVLDERRHIIMVNQAFTTMTGYAAADVIGQRPGFLKAGIEDDAFYKNLWEQVNRTGRFKGEIWHRKKEGQFFAAQVVVNAISDEDHLPNKYVVLLSDITEKKRSDDLLWSQANFDTLTGLPNRRFFRDRLEYEIRNAKRNNLPLALLFLDLDGFKDVNDTLGHDMGDVLLKEAAERLYRCVRETDTVARLGGDEFTIILPELHDPGNVDRVARQILRALSEPIQMNEDVAYVSASIGITLFPNDATEVEDLIRNADQAMYAAKESGKNQYHYFTPAMQEEAQRRMRIINDLRGALDANQFEIFYQPIINLSSGVIQKAEALIRWHHPEKGLVSPITFISEAEDAGMISAFGNWVFHEAAKQATVWREKHHPEFQVSVNISPVQFRKEGIDPSIWFGHLKELGLPGKGIVVEITEGLLLDASAKVTDQLLMLRDAGIEVALDDFGTGYSSLAYLKKFDIDYIKIDRIFVANLTEGGDDMALCQAIIVMAHQLGLRVIAEGIETMEQHALLVNAGCDFAQGYLFSRPLHIDDFEQLLNAAPFSAQEILDF